MTPRSPLRSLARSSAAPNAAPKGAPKLSPVAAPVAILVAAALGAGCHNRFEAKVEGVLVAECDSGEKLSDEMKRAPRVLVRADQTVPDEQLPLPAAGAVQLVIERSVPWARVETLLAILESKQLEPILVAGQTHELRRFRLNDRLTGAPKFTITGDAKGKFCVQTAQLPQAYCVAGAGRHVHRAFVRETVRDVVKKWEMREATAYVDPATEWADVVRIVDGARTCCGKDTAVLVEVSREAPLGDDAERGNPAILQQEREAAAAEGTTLEGDEAAAGAGAAAGSAAPTGGVGEGAVGAGEAAGSAAGSAAPTGGVGEGAGAAGAGAGAGAATKAAAPTTSVAPAPAPAAAPAPPAAAAPGKPTP